MRSAQKSVVATVPSSGYRHVVHSSTGPPVSACIRLTFGAQVRSAAVDTDNTTIPELITWSVGEYADTTAVIDGENRISYAELGARVDQAARAMVESGIAPDDAVSVWAPNRWEWIVAALAASRAGAILVPVNTRFKGPEAAYVLSKARVRLLFVANQLTSGRRCSMRASATSGTWTAGRLRASQAGR